MSFLTYYVDHRFLRTSMPYDKINPLINWGQIDKAISHYYRRGETL